jgi:hypothetical protein
MDKDEVSEAIKEEQDSNEEPQIHIVASDMKIIDPEMETSDKNHGECEEPGCTKPAVMEWNGFKVCNGHYNSYKAKEESLFGKGFPRITKDEEFNF